MSQPLVSVIVTAYNQAPFVAAALESVFAQTYKSYEVIVVDDGSTDDTRAAVAPFGDTLRYIRQANRGVAGSRNTGIRCARGDLFAFLDGDDLWEPHKLSAQVEAAWMHPASGLIATNGVQFDDTGILAQSLFGRPIQGMLDSGHRVLTIRCYPQLVEECVIHTTSQVMFPRGVAEGVGLSDETLRISSDYDLYLRIAARYTVTFLNERLVRWRYLSTSASGPRHLRSLYWRRDGVRILKQQLRDGPREHQGLIRRALARKVREAVREAYYFGRAGLEEDRRWATQYLLSILRSQPTSMVTLALLIASRCPESVIGRLGTLVRGFRPRR